MNITISKNDLSTALRRVQGACSGRSVIPALSGVLLRAKGEMLEAVASNGDMQISHSVPCGVLGAGEALIPLARLSLFVNQFGPQEISIDVDAKFRATLKSGAKRASLCGLNPVDFVQFTDEQRVAISMAQADLKSALKRTLIAVSTDVTRHILNGVHFELKENVLTMVSTSGRHLCRVTHEVQGDGVRATLPTKGATELMRLLDDEGSTVVEFGPNTAAFTVGDTVMTSKLMSEGYPNFRNAIPKECVERVAINREELLSSIRLVNSTEVDANKFPKILVKFERNRLSLESAWQTSDAGDSIAINYTGKDLTFPLEPDQVSEILSALTEDEVHIEMIDELSQFVIKAGNFLGLTMPYRPT